MKKKELIAILDSLNLNKNEYCIISGGSLLMYGIRETTRDIDLYVTEGELLRLKRIFIDAFKEEKTIDQKDTKYKLNDYIECFIKDKKKIKEHSILIDGYSCQKLDKIVELKKKLNREKDKKDLLLIDEYLKNK